MAFVAAFVALVGFLTAGMVCMVASDFREAMRDLHLSPADRRALERARQASTFGIVVGVTMLVMAVAFAARGLAG